ncbi:hypothetical protein [Sinimarinibacterium thermocellulolyticum]|uniref:Heme exporter protein D n=1 Tax=Sinimarinibacterium thermocellulolyticum TaxID=3170016 RepID=A0ABV2A5F6_9GAMM
MSVLPFVSFIAVTTAVLAFALLGLMVHDELKFQRRMRAANDARIPPTRAAQDTRTPAMPAPLPKAA